MWFAARPRGSAVVAALALSSTIGAVLWLAAANGELTDAGAERLAGGSAVDSARAVGGLDPRASNRPADGALVAAPAPSQVHAGRPIQITLPSGVAMHVDPSATGPDGVLQVPEDVRRAGWWDGSSRLGDPFGSIVIAAHVDSVTQGLGRFAELLGVRRGDAITLRSRELVRAYVVVHTALIPKSEVDADALIYSPSGPPRLVLITCGGDFAPETGYADNMVVVSRPAGPLHER